MNARQCTHLCRRAHLAHDFLQHHDASSHSASTPSTRSTVDSTPSIQLYSVSLVFLSHVREKMTMTEAEVDAAARRQYMDTRWARMRANREDCIGRRQVRDVKTRSKRKMKGKGGIKSPFEVPAGADK